MHFVFLAQSTQDGDGVFHAGFAHENNLEAALQRSVFLDVLAVFVERGCANGSKFAARQLRLQHVGGVNRAFRGSGSDQRVQFIDEQNDLPLGLLDLFQHGLEAIFKLAAILRAREHGSQVERHDTLVLQLLRHVTGNDALRQALDDGRLAHAGLADEDGVVLGAAR